MDDKVKLDQAAMDKLRNTCDVLNGQLQAQGLPIVVIPIQTLLMFQKTLEDYTALQKQMQIKQTAANVEFDVPTKSFDVAQDFNLGMAGGSPRPEHLHLCRDTAQDILNAAKKRRN